MHPYLLAGIATAAIGLISLFLVRKTGRKILRCSPKRASDWVKVGAWLFVCGASAAAAIARNPWEM